MTETLRGRALLGWMSSKDAVPFLRHDCVFEPPLSDDDAIALWREARARVLALGERPMEPASDLGLNAAELTHQERFLRFARSAGTHDVVGLRKVDLRQLVVHQHWVSLDHVERHAGGQNTPRAWLEALLPTERRNSDIGLRAVVDRRGDTYAEFDLPHGEFAFREGAKFGWFNCEEGLGHSTIVDGADRTVLIGGNHRCLAKLLAAPAGATPSAVLAVVRRPFAEVSVDGDPLAEDPLNYVDGRAARLGDYLVDGLFTEVRLRKFRYRMRVQATLSIELDEETGE